MGGFAQALLSPPLDYESDRLIISKNVSILVDCCILV